MTELEEKDKEIEHLKSENKSLRSTIFTLIHNPSFYDIFKRAWMYPCDDRMLERIKKYI